MKYAAIAIAVLVAIVSLQTWRLSNAHEEIGTINTALQVSNATLTEMKEQDLALNAVKAEIVKNRQARRYADKLYNDKVMKELQDVKTNECFRDTSVVPVQHIRVLNDQGNYQPPEPE